MPGDFALVFEPGTSDTRAVLRRLAAGQLGVAADDVPLVQRCPDCGGAHGAPAVEGSELRVSAARCAAGVVAVAARARAIGVDVELLAQPPELLAAIREIAGGEGVAHWTRVEAVLKADGRGLRVDPRAVRIAGDEATIEGGAARYLLVEPDVAPALQVTVALGV